MSDLNERVVVERDGETLHAILFRRDRGRTAELVEAALALNPGLARIGPHLPVGTEILLPPPHADDDGAREAAIVRLWD